MVGRTVGDGRMDRGSLVERYYYSKLLMRYRIILSCSLEYAG